MGKPRFSCWIQLVQISFLELSQKILKIPKPSNYIFFQKMGRKCCVTNCNGNHDSTSKEKTFRLPKDKDEREK